MCIFRYTCALDSIHSEHKYLCDINTAKSSNSGKQEMFACEISTGTIISKGTTYNSKMDGKFKLLPSCPPKFMLPRCLSNINSTEPYPRCSHSAV